MWVLGMLKVTWAMLSQAKYLSIIDFHFLYCEEPSKEHPRRSCFARFCLLSLASYVLGWKKDCNLNRWGFLVTWGLNVGVPKTFGNLSQHLIKSGFALCRVGTVVWVSSQVFYDTITTPNKQIMLGSEQFALTAVMKLMMLASLAVKVLLKAKISFISLILKKIIS